MDFIEKGARRSQELITDVLAFSRVNEIDETSFEKVDLNVLFGQIDERLSADQPSGHGKLVWHDLPSVQGNRSLLDQLFQNLVINGYKFNENQQPTVKVSATTTADGIQVSVCDNGIGINPKYREKIFRLFARLHNQDEYTGTGLGLAICKKIVDHHQGQIWVSPDSQQGSTFIVQFPDQQTSTTQS